MPIFTKFKAIVITRMPSSRMRIVRSSNRLSGGSASVHAGIPTPPPDQTPPGIRPPQSRFPPEPGTPPGVDPRNQAPPPR